jgi:hypothetical protein
VSSLPTLHEHYEGLCAAAVTGQISPDQLADLKQHMRTCADCREFVGDAAQVVAQAIPEYAVKNAPVEVPSGLTEPFIVRANVEGIPLRSRTGREKSRIKSGIAMFVWAAGLTAAVAGVLWMVNIYPEMGKPQRRAQAAAASDTTIARDGNIDQLVRENVDLRRKFGSLTKQIDSLAREVKSEQRALEVADLQKNSLSTRLPSIERDNAELRKKLADRDEQFEQLNSELNKAQSLKEANDIALQMEEAELKNLRENEARLTTELRESRQLSKAANQAKEIIVARKLHLVDVDDTDPNGKQQRPFGRIFYTEGKDLVFYAYDLADPRKRNFKTNFYVWGSREGVGKPVKSLGVFLSDDIKEGRWRLEIDDPNILAQIDCVFVTAESDKEAVTRPTGKQILFASLGRANHP